MRAEPSRLQLSVAGKTERCLRSVRNISLICESKLSKNHLLEVVTLYQQPELTCRVQVIAAPTLIKLFPWPVRRLIGDITNTDKVLSSWGWQRVKTVR